MINRIKRRPTPETKKASPKGGQLPFFIMTSSFPFGLAVAPYFRRLPGDQRASSLTPLFMNMSGTFILKTTNHVKGNLNELIGGLKEILFFSHAPINIIQRIMRMGSGLNC